GFVGDKQKAVVSNTNSDRPFYPCLSQVVRTSIRSTINCRYNSLWSYFSDCTISRISHKHISVLVSGDPASRVERRGVGLPMAVPWRTCSSIGSHKAILGNLADAVIVGVGDKNISGLIGCNADRSIELGFTCWTIA